MRIFNNINSPHNAYPVNNQTMSSSQVRYNNTLSCDKFEHTNPITYAQQSYPIGAVRFGSSVSNGAFLRNLSGVHDPYSGVVILNNKELNQFYQDLAKKDTGVKKINLLENYTESMFPVEKSVYYLMFGDILLDNRRSMQDVLQAKQPRALKNLIKTQQQVFNNIDDAAQNLSENNKLKVEHALNKAREQILISHKDKNHFRKGKFENDLMRIAQSDVFARLENKMNELPEEEKDVALEKLYNVERIFETTPYYTNIKGKTPLKMVHELQAEYLPESLKEENEMQPILDLVQDLPTTKTDVNAFIVEMSDKDDSVIAKRLISESIGTIEHVVPESKGGENEADNFMFVTKARNEERGNKSLNKFKKMHPDIPKNCQQYLDDVIKNCEDGRMRGYEWYPFVIRDIIKSEVGVNVAIKSYRMSPQKAFRTFPNRLKEKYPQYNKYFTKPQ